MSTTLAASSGLLLEDVDWKTYTRLLRVFEDRPGYRLAYDRGRLEIMSPRFDHEFDNHLLDRFVLVLTEELNLNLKSGGSATLRMRRKKRGIESDHCYWITNEPKIRGKRQINLKVDPPPDLAVEVEVSRKCLDRLPIYAALKVPEIWRFDGETLRVCHLHKGKYRERKHSLAFPFLPLEKFAEFIRRIAEEAETSLLRDFVEWVRADIVPTL